MKLRRKPAAAARRQRLAEDQPSKLSSFSYSSRQSDQTERVTRQALAKQVQKPVKHIVLFWLSRIGLLIFLIAIIASTINVLRLTPSVKIISLNQASSSTYLQPDSVYATAANNQLKSSIWNRSKVTVDASGLGNYLRQQFPELSDVSVTMPLLAHRPLVYIQAAQPALVLNTSGGSFVIGTSGKALDRLAPSEPAPVGLPNLVDQSGLQIQLRQQALPASDVKFVQIVAAELAAKNIVVTNFTLPSASSELDAHLTGQPYVVKFNLQSTDAAGEAGTYLATAANLKGQNITPTQYIDVRVDGRAYYK
jgi:hypothetical protein